MPTACPAPPALRWDLFCRVIDNFGDIGVCWRLARQLAACGQQVRLWVDDASALHWMAPGVLHADAPSHPAQPLGLAPGIAIHGWPSEGCAAQLAALPRAQVWLEAFGGDIPADFIHAQRPSAGPAQPLWLNLEYLSAEPYVERSHGLPSPISHGPAAGLQRWFYYPGFTPRTGGLLREGDLLAQQAAFRADAWLGAQGIPNLPGACRLSLFCYEPPALAAWLQQLAQAAQPTQLLVTAGRAARAVRAALHSLGQPGARQLGALHLHELPLLSQPDYDRLLWACDLNLVRGEDSLVRALWAGQPLGWQLYPQEDGVHADKLDAFLGQLAPPPAVQRWHRVWNGTAPGLTLPAWDADLWADWQRWATATRSALLAQDDLTRQLLGFVMNRQ